MIFRQALPIKPTSKRGTLTSGVRWLVSVFVFAAYAQAGEILPGERTLETELKVSGPAVFMRAPLGLRYRPGYLFPLQFRVQNAGTIFNAEVFVLEGSDENGLRNGDFSNTSFQTHSSRQVTLPVRAAAVTSNLSFVVRGSEHEGGVPLQYFRARLRDLKPLAPDARLILTVGRSDLNLSLGLDSMVSQKPKEMLEETWMYDSVDVVVLRDDALKEASPAAKNALREFVLSGGRLLLTSQAALQVCIAEQLLPLPSPSSPNALSTNSATIGASLSWWEQNAGLKASDVLIEHNHRPVYCRLNLGAGLVIFLFPATDEMVAQEAGPKIFSSPLLYRSREKLSDWRIQDERSSAFSSGEVHSDRAHSAVLWMALGALMFCVVLTLALTSRSRLETLGLPVALAALLAVLLAQWLPEPNLICSRVLWEQYSSDGKSVAKQEWKWLESFRNPHELSASAPDGANLGLIFDRPETLAQAQADLERVNGHLQLSHFWVENTQPVLLYASRTEALSATAAAISPTVYTESQHKLKLALPIALPDGVQHKTLILARANGTLWYVNGLADSAGFTLKRYDSPLAAIQTSLNLAGENARARAVALGWATRFALRSKTDTLICWGEVSEDAVKSLVELDASHYEMASSLLLWSCEVRVDE